MFTMNIFFISLAMISFLLFIVHENLATLQESQPNKSFYSNSESIELNDSDIKYIQLGKKVQDFSLELNTSTILIENNQSNRSLGTSCPVENCNICDESQHCKVCSEGFKNDGKKCVSNKKQNKNTESMLKIIIMIAFSMLPLLFFIICCFVCLHFRRRNAGAQNRRVFGENIMFEVQNNLRLREAELIRLNQLSSSAEDFIYSESNLMITSENFSARFPAIKIVSELMSESCTICFEQFDDNKTLRITPCGHIFHHNCLYEWVITNDQSRCPNDNIKLS